MPEIAEITAAEFQRELGRWQDEAMRRPLRITRHGRARLVLLSVEEFEALVRVARGNRVAVRAEDLSDADAEIIASARAPQEAHDYDHEFFEPAPQTG